MSEEQMARLDEGELLHLSLEASRERRHGDAIAYLKQLIERSPANHQALHLLAAQHAQIGLTDRAIEEFNQALGIEPGLFAARFQLGLLLLCNARVEEALAAWKPLDELPESDPFLHFKRGLERLCRDDFAGCEESLRRGMELNTTNAALNADMQRVLDDVRRKLAGQAAQSNDPAGHILLNAYTNRLG
jgi:tetratricopeptide (TPR) repeat protein